MTRSVSEDGDHPIWIGGHHPVVENGGQAAVENGGSRPVENGGPRRAPTRPAGVRLPQALDYRLRGLRAEGTDDVPSTSAPTQRRQRHRRRLLTKMAAFVAVAALAVLLLQAFVIQPYTVPGTR